MINLIVVSHPDDEVLGFGATGLLLTKSGEIVIPLILCGQVEERNFKPSKNNFKKNILEASKILGFSEPILGNFPNIQINNIPHIELVKFIEKYIIEIRPNRIFTHHPYDLNDDHKHISEACLVASRIFQRRNQISPINSLYFMEILSATDWSYGASRNIFTPNVFIDVKETIHEKIKALNSYEGVMRNCPHPRSKEVILGHSRYRGGQSGFDYAESFELVFNNKL